MSYVKGNWEVNGFEIQTKGKETFIAEVYQENKDAKANAKLIAAAPELLEACKELRQFLKDGDYINVSGREKFKAIMHQSQQAITKAEAKCL